MQVHRDMTCPVLNSEAQLHSQDEFLASAHSSLTTLFRSTMMVQGREHPARLSSSNRRCCPDKHGNPWGRTRFTAKVQVEKWRRSTGNFTKQEIIIEVDGESLAVPRGRRIISSSLSDTTESLRANSLSPLRKISSS